MIWYFLYYWWDCVKMNLAVLLNIFRYLYFFWLVCCCCGHFQGIHSVRIGRSPKPTLICMICLGLASSDLYDLSGIFWLFVPPFPTFPSLTYHHLWKPAKDYQAQFCHRKMWNLWSMKIGAWFALICVSCVGLREICESWF